MNGFDDFDLFETCEEYYDDANEFEIKYANDESDLDYTEKLMRIDK